MQVISTIPVIVCAIENWLDQSAKLNYLINSVANVLRQLITVLSSDLSQIVVLKSGISQMPDLSKKK